MRAKTPHTFSSCAAKRTPLCANAECCGNVGCLSAHCSKLGANPYILSCKHFIFCIPRPPITHHHHLDGLGWRFSCPAKALLDEAAAKISSPARRAEAVTSRHKEESAGCQPSFARAGTDPDRHDWFKQHRQQLFVVRRRSGRRRRPSTSRPTLLLILLLFYPLHPLHPNKAASFVDSRRCCRRRRCTGSNPKPSPTVSTAPLHERRRRPGQEGRQVSFDERRATSWLCAAKEVDVQLHFNLLPAPFALGRLQAGPEKSHPN